jgi:hypothetical protein
MTLPLLAAIGFQHSRMVLKRAFCRFMRYSILCWGRNYSPGKLFDTRATKQRIYALPSRFNAQPAELNKITSFPVGKKGQKKPPCDWR